MSATFAPRAVVAILHLHSVEDPRGLCAGGKGPSPGSSGKAILHRSVEAGLARGPDRDDCMSAGTETDSRNADQHTAVLIEVAPCV